MKIGILTFHWATNYGAILQAFCLQEFLCEQGHEVEIINYKPKRYDFSWIQYLKSPRRLKNLRKDLISRKKETLLVSFRKKYLNQTKRYYSTEELQKANLDYDLFISGSDQVLNPFYTAKGEGKPTSAYYLSFAPKDARRIGYAVSFGCVQYPEQAALYASEWIQDFDAIGTRENTGLNILHQLGFNGQSSVVPDPTILYGRKLYEALGVSVPIDKQPYICVYMLRREIRLDGHVKYIDETKLPINMHEWLSTISSAKGLITNSYHGMIMAILAHVPFVVLLETGKAGGMNDRFSTLLSKLGLNERICITEEKAREILPNPINWAETEECIVEYKAIGSNFSNSFAI